MTFLNLIFIGINLIFLIIVTVVTLSVYNIAKSFRFYAHKNPFMPKYFMIKRLSLLHLITIVILSIGFTIYYFSL